jgi:cell division protease FtsH
MFGLLLLRNVFSEAGVQRVSYSRFKDALREERFKHVVVANDWLKGYLAIPTPQGDKGLPSASAGRAAALPWLAHRVQGDPELLQILEEQDTDYERGTEDRVEAARSERL